jgi:hypothetical protein
MARKGKPGDIVRIDIGDGRHTYGQLVTAPYVAVYDFPTTEQATDPAEVVGKPILFTVGVYDRAIGRRGWPVIGQAPPGSPGIAVPEQFMQDPFNPASLRIIDADGNMRPATYEECEGLEPCSVWEAEHVAGRIRDHYAGRPNVALEHMKLRVP